MLVKSSVPSIQIVASVYCSQFCDAKCFFVLSPFLFALYVSDIVNARKCSSSAEIILYADDILLISTSVGKLQDMLYQCEQKLDWLDMSINESKSYCLRIGNRRNAQCASITTSSGHKLEWVNEIRYLGVYIVSSRLFKCSFKQAKSSFYRATNAVFSKI